MNSKALKKEFAAKGYNLEKFTTSDTRRIDGDGTVYNWYAADSGMLKANFRDLADAAEWIEFK